MSFFCSCRSLVDTIYSLKDEVQELKQVSAPIDECHWCRKIRCFQQNTRLGILATCCSCCPPPSLFKDNKRMRRTLEEEQRARKELERIIRRVLKNMNDPSWDETNLWDQYLSQGRQQDCWGPSCQVTVDQSGPSAKTHCYPLKPKLAGRRDDITLQCAALPYLWTFIRPFSTWLSPRQSYGHLDDWCEDSIVN